MCYRLQSLTLSDLRKEFLGNKWFSDCFATVKFFVQVADNRNFDTLYYCRFLFDGGDAAMLAETLWSLLRAVNVISVKVTVTSPDSVVNDAALYTNTFLSGHGLASGCN